MNAEPAKPRKATVQLRADLVELLRVLKPLLKLDMNEMLEPGGWELVRAHRERIEAALGHPIEIPDPAQLQLATAA